MHWTITSRFLMFASWRLKIVSWVSRYVLYFQTRRERSQVDAIVPTSVHMETFQILRVLETVHPSQSLPLAWRMEPMSLVDSQILLCAGLSLPGEGVLCWAGGRIQLSSRSSDVFPNRRPTPGRPKHSCQMCTLGERLTLFGDIRHCLGSLRTWKHPAVTSPDPQVVLHGVLADLP